MDEAKVRALVVALEELIRNAVFVSLENPKSIEFWREVLAMETVWFESSREVYDMAHYATCGSDHSEAERLLARMTELLQEGQYERLQRVQL